MNYEAYKASMQERKGLQTGPGLLPLPYPAHGLLPELPLPFPVIDSSLSAFNFAVGTHLAYTAEKLRLESLDLLGLQCQIPPQPQTFPLSHPAIINPFLHQPLPTPTVPGLPSVIGGPMYPNTGTVRNTQEIFTAVTTYINQMGHQGAINSKGPYLGYTNNVVNPGNENQSRWKYRQRSKKWFQCFRCNRNFGYKHALQNHLRTHTSENRWNPREIMIRRHRMM